MGSGLWGQASDGETIEHGEYVSRRKASLSQISRTNHNSNKAKFPTPSHVTEYTLRGPNHRMIIPPKRSMHKAKRSIQTPHQQSLLQYAKTQSIPTESTLPQLSQTHSIHLSAPRRYPTSFQSIPSHPTSSPFPTRQNKPLFPLFPPHSPPTSIPPPPPTYHKPTKPRTATTLQRTHRQNSNRTPHQTTPHLRCDAMVRYSLWGAGRITGYRMFGWERGKDGIDDNHCHSGGLRERVEAWKRVMCLMRRDVMID